MNSPHFKKVPAGVDGSLSGRYSASMTMTDAAEREYAVGYEQGHEAGGDYPFDDDFRTLFPRLAGHLANRQPFYLGWARGFRHAVMEKTA